jgi:multimeric flavodoxin WrbA
MNVVALNGSYRKKGNTSHMVESVLRGCREAGAETNHILLLEKNIKPCRGCMSCFEDRENIIGKCVQKDDMRKLLEEVISADALISACPIYWGSLSAPMVAFMHRMTPLAYDRALDGGIKGVPVYKLSPEKPGMFVTSMVAPFPINYFYQSYRSFYGFHKNILRLAGYKTKFVLNEGGSEMGVPIPERERLKEKAFSLGQKLVGG